jgi:hypothetical protein
MAFAASQFGPLVQVPSADPDTDMLSDAADEGRDFDIDVDAISVGEGQDVDFVLDGEAGAEATQTGAETVDQVMLEATTEQKTSDAPMGEPDLVPDEIMDAVNAPHMQGNDGQVGGGLLAPEEGHGADQKTSVVGDGHDSQVASSQQYSGDGVNQSNHPTLDRVSSVSAATLLESSAADAKTSDEDHNLPLATEPRVERDLQPNEPNFNPSRDPQADGKEAEKTPTHSKPGSASNPSIDLDRNLEIDESIRKNPNQEHGNDLENDDSDEGEHAEQHENSNEEHNTLSKPDSSEYAALVLYSGSKLSLFPPAVDGLPESYLVEDASLAERALRELFVACRQVLGANIGEDSQLQMEIPGLQLIFQEVCDSIKTLSGC